MNSGSSHRGEASKRSLHLALLEWWLQVHVDGVADSVSGANHR